MTIMTIDDGYTARMFERCIGIDYSGARTPDTPLPGVRVFMAEGAGDPREIRPDDDPKRHWTRRGVHAWLSRLLREDARTIIGIDHGLSFPRAYFERHHLPLNWSTFLDDFCAHWPTDRPDIRVEDVRHGHAGNGKARGGDSRWRRCVEHCVPGTKSVFHFDVPGSVAKSTHAGLPWVRQLRELHRDRLHVWPFDGWSPGDAVHVIAEVFPTLWRDDFPRVHETDDQHDACVVASWLRQACRIGELTTFLRPTLSADALHEASFEGWILGIATDRPTDEIAAERDACRPIIDVMSCASQVRHSAD